LREEKDDTVADVVDLNSNGVNKNIPPLAKELWIFEFGNRKIQNHNLERLTGKEFVFRIATVCIYLLHSKELAHGTWKPSMVSTEPKITVLFLRGLHNIFQWYAW
jgi:hypothetical protein